MTRITHTEKSAIMSPTKAAIYAGTGTLLAGAALTALVATAIVAAHVLHPGAGHITAHVFGQMVGAESHKFAVLLIGGLPTAGGAMYAAYKTYTIFKALREKEAEEKREQNYKRFGIPHASSFHADSGDVSYAPSKEPTEKDLEDDWYVTTSSQPSEEKSEEFAREDFEDEGFRVYTDCLGHAHIVEDGEEPDPSWKLVDPII